ncbi:MAG TPA: c-type cytochrome [Patescibacteria group bacterium]|nr:c-type cytochrome [Patescibacteria group bacterium]
MTAIFWERMHGASTHFPIVLLLASGIFDFVAWRARDEALRRGLHAAGFGSAVAGMLGGLAAVVAGLFITHGRLLGGGYERMHHLFVWPAVIISVVLVGCRVIRRVHFPERGFPTYLTGMAVVCALMVGAGYSGGEMVLDVARAEERAPSGLVPLLSTGSSPERGSQKSAPEQSSFAAAGRQSFLKNCAHCHGADARGEEGPDLHKLDLTDEQIVARIRNGKKGQMTAFAGKLSPDQIRTVVAYLRT